MVLVTVDNRIRIRARELPRELRVALKEDFEHKNPEFGSKQAMGITTWGVSRTIRTWRFEKGHLTFPRGGMKRVRERLAEFEVKFRVKDARTEGMPTVGFPKYVGDPLRYYQEEAIQAALGKEQCILRAPTGSGKTTMAFALIARIGLNALIILPTNGLFKQWAQRAKKELGLSGTQLGVIKGKTRRLRPVTIAMHKTLTNEVRADELDYFGALAVDEAQLASAKTYVEVIDKFPARYRVAVSADERRKDRKEFLAYDLFSDVAHEVKRDVLEREKHVLEVEIRVVPTEFRADWYGLPDENDEKRKDKEIDFNRLLDEMMADEARNALATRFVAEELAAGEQAIILTDRRDHVKTIDRYFVERGIPSGYLLGNENAGDEAEFERSRKGIEDGTVRVGIGTFQALGYGIDLPAVTVGAMITPKAGNPQQFNQGRGRLCRPNPKAGKTEGRLYYLWDQHVYPGHLQKLVSGNPRVIVWTGRKWIDARDFLAMRRRKRRAS